MKKIAGFTLVELAIVLTVISLIAGGIIAARSIIRVSQIQAVMGEYQMYAAAIKNFQNKYHALPGDFSTASALWGEVSGGCQYGTGTGTQTCNGDGDGAIEFDAATPNYEHITAWRHLGLSGLINQNYTGNTASGTISCAIDIKGNDNVPSSKLKGASWNLGATSYVGVGATSTAYTTGVAGSYFPMSLATDMPTLHALWLGVSLQNDTIIDCALSQIPVLTGQEAYEMDMKYDDNVSTSGKIRAQYNNTATYQTCEDLTSTRGAYRTSATGINCALAFILEP